MEPRVNLITLSVADLPRAIHFYHVRQLLAADAQAPEAGTGFGGITQAHNVTAKAEVDAVLAEAEATGGTLLKAMGKAEWSGYSGYFANPDGYPWEVGWNPDFPLAPHGAVLLPDCEVVRARRSPSLFDTVRR